MDDPTSPISIQSGPRHWTDHTEERDYSCIAASRFRPLLLVALHHAHAMTIGPEGVQTGLLPDPGVAGDLAGVELLARRSGIDKKLIKRIAAGRALTVPLTTADALLTSVGLPLPHHLVIPTGRRAARRMAEDEADARRMRHPSTFIAWRADQLYRRRLRHLNDAPSAPSSRRAAG